MRFSFNQILLEQPKHVGSFEGFGIRRDGTLAQKRGQHPQDLPADKPPYLEYVQERDRQINKTVLLKAGGPAPYLFCGEMFVFHLRFR
jgi:hypothetical protein